MTNYRTCFLCGAWVVSGRSPFWGFRYRVLYAVRDECHQARISPVTCLENDVPDGQLYNLVIPWESDFGAEVPRHAVNDDWVKVGYPKTGHPSPDIPVWGFPIHDDCWNILCEDNDHMSQQTHIQALLTYAPRTRI
ncbi:unnamed protein product [Clonostachys rosea]|uniref:Uncharacterized protein n=1 Tax=Bionectria ochroleuca TaxID=29856 RepID=A0ABY6UC45_BIOOC|nr:unnamed protein product [Clonostachys rosea]